MFIKKLAIAALAAIGISVLLISTALALDVDLPVVGSGDERTLGSLQSVDDLESLRRPYTADASQRAELAKVVETSSTAPAESAARGIEPSKARPASENVWIAPTSDGRLCVFVPANGGFNWSCGTVEDIRTTGIASVSSGADGKVVAVVVGPNGAPDPTVRSSTGSVRTVEYAGSVAVTVLKPGETLDTGSVSIPSPPPIPSH